jgi:hypothetical protein
MKIISWVKKISIKAKIRVETTKKGNIILRNLKIDPTTIFTNTTHPHKREKKTQCQCFLF